MSYISLYRKYRPSTFSDVVGQDIVVKTLKNSIINNKISHAYIFSGPKGTGKTSIAKIFAKAVNCENNKDGDLCQKCDNCLLKNEECIDIIEIDAASNNGVDEIREIRNNVKLLPSKFKYKIYIVDEVHMLSTSAFNALLKTLEEPPAHVIFILATTEIHKIPATVLSRCQKFDFKKIPEKLIVDRLKYILKEEKNTIDDDVLNLIATLSNGGLRDAINLLDQLLSLNDNTITQTNVFNLIGGISEEESFKLFDCIVEGNIKELDNLSQNYYEEGKKLSVIVDSLVNIVKNILIFNGTSNYFDKKYESKLAKYSKLDINNLYTISDQLIALNSELKKSDNQIMLFKIYLFRLSLLVKKEYTFERSGEAVVVENQIIGENKENLSKNVEIDKSIDINNCFATASKKYKEDFISKFDNIKDYLTVKEYNSIAKLLLKSSVQAVGDKNAILTFSNNFEVVLFDNNSEEANKLINKVLDSNYKTISISEEEWNKIKEEYIKNIKNGVKYTYIEPKKIVKRKSSKKNDLENSVLDIFGDNYKSEK